MHHYVSKELLKTVYYSIFDSHMRYACQVWGQTKTHLFGRIGKSQNKALRLLNFKHSRESSDPLYKEMKILKLEDVILLNNCLFIFDHLNKTLPTVFDD